MVKSMLEQSLPKVVVINMVGLDWLSIPILNELRDNYAMLPALTGVKDKEHIKAVLELKPSGYLLKPASVDSIFGIIDKVIG